MKRWPVVASFVLFVLLCATLAYWGMQWFKPPVRPVAPPPLAANTAPPLQAASTLFGGRSGPVAVASNYQLRGVVVSGKPGESIAILSANGKPTQYVVANGEVVPGVTVKEVHRQYVVLSDGGVDKRVELPADAKMAGAIGTTDISRVPGATPPVAARSAPAMPTSVVSPPNASPSTALPANMSQPGTAPATLTPPVIPPIQPGMPQSPAAAADQSGATMSGASSTATTSSGGAQIAPQSTPQSAATAAVQPAQQASPNQGGAATAQQPQVAGSRAANATQAAQPGAMQQPYQPFATQPRQ